ncbi:corticotropin-releasing factor-binding protein-like [Diadema setosum]|uniref:corticotropin-releasing factor-binding protein-like n=1 Tax=Diadema setosum TaxID=31175 RepID=UPI003B3B324A
MTSLYCQSIFVVVMMFCSHTLGIEEQATHLRGDHVDISMLRRNVDDGHPTDDFYSRDLACRVDMVGLEGTYYYTARPENAGTVCATYLLAESNDLVEIEFTEFDVDCSDPENEVQFFDGWTMGYGSFPGVDDHPLTIAERVVNVCSQRSRVFRSHQNGAMITFKLTDAAASFAFTFRPIHNPEPCNVIAPEPSGAHTLRNYGNERNCSFSIIYPVTIHIWEMAVGGYDNGDARLRCHMGLDYVELLEGNSLDMSAMITEGSICGHVGSIVRQNGDGDSLNRNNHIVPGESSCQSDAFSIPLMCHNSVIRLVSSSQYVNEVSFRFNRLNIARSECPETDV